MTLSEILTPLGQTAGENFPITGICADTKLIKPGEVFIALQGEKTHGVHYLNEAIKKGAVAAMIDGLEIRAKIPCIRIRHLKKHLPKILDIVYPIPENLRLVGITGTNGKTTTSFFIRQLLDFLAVKNGIITTLGIRGISAKTRHTTPDMITLRKMLTAFGRQNMQVAVVEVSSHAIDQGRISGLNFEIAVFTNLSHDHLDYHRNMENYRRTKMRLFQAAEYSIINRDDQNARHFFQAAGGEKIGYGLSDLKNLKIRDDGFDFEMDGRAHKIPLIGTFNLSNMLAACSAVAALGFEKTRIFNHLDKLKTPPGRLQKIKHHPIWVDYAHTPDALLNALSALGAHQKKRPKIVFGCGGERDFEKRAMMGKIAGKHAKSIVLTNDNPRSEDPQKIIREIERGIRGCPTEIIIDRKTAITRSISKLSADDCLLIAGKGHESSQDLGAQVVPFDDFKTASDAAGRVFENR